MANETIVSPGVFTRENDQSFLPQGIGQIGAAIVGPTLQGPAFVPIVIRNGFSEFQRRFGDLSKDTYVPQTVREYLRSAGSVTVCRVLAGGGYSFDGSTKKLVALVTSASSTDATNHAKILTVLYPSQNKDNAASLELQASSIVGEVIGETDNTTVGGNPSGTVSISGSFRLLLSGAAGSAKELSCSLVPTKDDYIEQTLGVTGKASNSKTGANTYEFTAFPYLNFKQEQSRLSDSGSLEIALVANTNAITFTSSFAEGYKAASTPYITSQFDVAKNTTNLFKFHTLADGTNTNGNYKVSIANLKEPANINGEEQYSRFSVIIREHSDSDKSLSILETYNNCTLDPDDVNYISRKIGDRYAQFNKTLGKVELKGNYPNISNFIRVEVTNQVEEGALSPKLSPYGFKALSDTITGFFIGSVTASLPSATYITSSTDINNNFNTNVYLGWSFYQTTDNHNWINPVPTDAPSNSSGDFNVGNYFIHPNSSIGYGDDGTSLSASLDTTGVSGPTNTFLKFTLPFQGGLDGVNPTVVPQTGENIEATNLYGFDLSGTDKAGYKGYKKALDILSNQDEYDINMLALPGVIKTLHSSVTNAAIDMVEARSDAFYVMDLNEVNDSINTAVNATDGLDTNYAAAYYPWVKVLDTSRNKPIFVPPSVVVPGAIAASDALQAEWFAPAGLNRGVLGNVLEARIRLNQSERDNLYEASINPIATFPQTGICIWGQKTLQLKSSALDRINVRRLLIAVKKFIGSSSRYLLFEQNTAATRNRFLNIVNPYLESIQSRQGLFAFRVQMDEANNTADVIDRNQLVGAIYLQPTKTAEFIILDFNVLPTGATFGE
mgnify:CR=1 FL=1|tara:strand:- start:204 stop:2717 length:2514 start_codon:yes stop_codon:yes gene_type:complete